MFEKITTRLGAGFFLFLLVTQIAGCKAGAGIQPSQATANQFLTQMKAKQPAAAYALLTTECKALTSSKKMQEYWTLVENNKGKPQSWTQQGVNARSGVGSMAGNVVQLNYVLQCTKGTTNVTIVCSEENGKWLIQGFNYQL